MKISLSRIFFILQSITLVQISLVFLISTFAYSFTTGLHIADYVVACSLIVFVSIWLFSGRYFVDNIEAIISKRQILILFLSFLVFSTSQIKSAYNIPIWRDELADYDLSKRQTPVNSCSLQSQPPLNCGWIKLLQKTDLQDPIRFRWPSVFNNLILGASILIFLFYLTSSAVVSSFILFIFLLASQVRPILIEMRPYSLGFLLSFFLTAEIFLYLLQLKPSSFKRIFAQFGTLSFFVLMALGFQNTILVLTYFIVLLFLFLSQKKIILKPLVQSLGIALLLGLAYQLYLIKFSIVAQLGLNQASLLFSTLITKIQNPIEFLSVFRLWPYLVFVSVATLFFFIRRKKLNQPLQFLVFSIFLFSFLYVFLFNSLITTFSFMRYSIVFICLILILSGYIYYLLQSKIDRVSFLILCSTIFTFPFFSAEKNINRFDYKNLENYMKNDLDKAVNTKIAVICFDRNYGCFSLNEANYFLQLYFPELTDIKFQGKNVGSLEFFSLMQENHDYVKFNILIERNGFADYEVLKFIQQVLPPEQYLLINDDVVLLFEGSSDQVRQKWFKFLEQLDFKFGRQYEAISEYKLQIDFSKQDKASYLDRLGQLRSSFVMNKAKYNFYRRYSEKIQSP